MTKWQTHQRAFERGHNDLFSPSGYDATFYNYNSGSYDPSEGEITGENRNLLATLHVEITPPSIDSTVDTDGTSLGFDTSIRFPLSSEDETITEDRTIVSGETRRYDSLTIQSGVTLTVDGTLLVNTLTVNGTLVTNGDVMVIGGSNVDPFAKGLVPLGEDNERPTEVEISNPKEGENDTYELHGYKYEKGSAMVMCRLVEQ